MSAKEDHRSKDELLHTISHLEGQLQEEVSSVRNFSIIGIGVFAAGLVGLLVFDASSIPLEHSMLPALNIADQKEREFDIAQRTKKRDLKKSSETLMSDTLNSGRAILAESNFGAIYGPQPDDANAVRIASIVEGSSAAVAKLEVGQVIESMDGKKLRHPRDYRRALQALTNQQAVMVGVAGQEPKKVIYDAKIAFPDFKHGLEHFAHAIDEKTELFWEEQKIILLKYQAKLFKLNQAVKLAENYVVPEGAENERLKTAKVAVENLTKDHKKKMEVREKGLQEALKLSAGHFAELCEKNEGLKELIFGEKGFLTSYSKVLNNYWGPRVDGEVEIESGRAFAFAKDQTDAYEAYQVYSGWLEPKLIEYFGTPTEPRMKGFNDISEFAEDEGIDEPGEKSSVSLLKQGQAFYFRHCQHCHGVSGYGDGPTAPFLNPRPRNYTYGIFKMRSNTSNKPSIKDLERTIKYGMPGSMMPPFELYRATDIKAVSHYVRYLAVRGEVEKMLYDTQIKNKVFQATLKDAEDGDDPLADVKDSFTEFYGLVKIGWHSVNKLKIEVEGEPVKPFTKKPKTPDAEMLGGLHKDRLAVLGSLSTEKPWKEIKAQKEYLETALEAIKSANDKALEPLKAALADWKAKSEEADAKSVDKFEDDHRKALDTQGQLIETKIAEQADAKAAWEADKSNGELTNAKIAADKAVVDAKAALAKMKKDYPDKLAARKEDFKKLQEKVLASATAASDAALALDKSWNGESASLEAGQSHEALSKLLKNFNFTIRVIEKNLAEWIKHSDWKASVGEGNELFQVNCAKCHNHDGRGGDIGVQVDAWGYDVYPRNLTRNVYRGGDRPIDFYWRISGGIDASQMPSFRNLSSEQRWAIVNHVKNLATNEGRK